MTHEDHSLNKAIQASLKDFTEDTDAYTVTESIREGGRPIAISSSMPSLAYAALVLQAMYFVPQVRSAVANLWLPEIAPQSLPGDTGRAMWNLIEVERIFSGGRDTISLRRASLQPETIRILMLVKRKLILAREDSEEIKSELLVQ